MGWRFLCGLECLHVRRSSVERLNASPVRHLLIVCYGNIYRSAFVAAYLATRLGPDVEVRSRGLAGPSGRASPPRHVVMCREHGIDLSQHRSALIEDSDLHWADCIVIMDRNNWIRLRSSGVDARKLVWLGAMASGEVEIRDPYHMDDAGAARLLRRLVRCADALADRVARSRLQPP